MMRACLPPVRGGHVLVRLSLLVVVGGAPGPPAIRVIRRAGRCSGRADGARSPARRPPLPSEARSSSLQAAAALRCAGALPSLSSRAAWCPCSSPLSGLISATAAATLQICRLPLAACCSCCGPLWPLRRSAAGCPAAAGTLLVLQTCLILCGLYGPLLLCRVQFLLPTQPACWWVCAVHLMHAACKKAQSSSHACALVLQKTLPTELNTFRGTWCLPALVQGLVRQQQGVAACHPVWKGRRARLQWRLHVHPPHQTRPLGKMSRR